MPVPAFAPDEAENAYFSALAEKIMGGEAARPARLSPGSAAGELILRFAERPFEEGASALLAWLDEAIRAAGAGTSGFDLAVFSWQAEGDPWLCLCRLPWREALLHAGTRGEGGVSARLSRSAYGMPAPGARETGGMTVNLSTGEIRLREISVATAEGLKPFFSGVCFSLQTVPTEKEAVRAVQKALTEAAPEEMAAKVQPAIRGAMARSARENGMVDAREVAETVFADAPDRDEIVRRVEERLSGEAVAPVVEVASPRVQNTLQRLKLKTDTGVTISLPQALAEDSERFSVIDNGDGTITIAIGGVSQLRAEN